MNVHMAVFYSCKIAEKVFSIGNLAAPIPSWKKSQLHVFDMLSLGSIMT